MVSTELLLTKKVSTMSTLTVSHRSTQSKCRRISSSLILLQWLSQTRRSSFLTSLPRLRMSVVKSGWLILRRTNMRFQRSRAQFTACKSLTLWFRRRGIHQVSWTSWLPNGLQKWTVRESIASRPLLAFGGSQWMPWMTNLEFNLSTAANEEV